MGGQVQDEFSGIAMTIGGYSMRDAEEQTFFGKDNPAGLDLRGETIAMGLAAQRALLYARAGEAAKAFVQSFLKEADTITIYTSRSDKYDRYLADVFAHGEAGEVFVNNLLLERGHARRMNV
jgi:hypothetical protein